MDEKNIHRIVISYKDTIYRIAFHYTQNWMDAEDITQEVFLKWLNKQPSFSSKEHEKAWLIRVTINFCKDFLKVKKSKGLLLFNENITQQNYKSTTNNISNLELIDLIFRLPEKYRVVIYLHYFEDLKLNEISKILRKSPNTIQTWHERAKKKLRTMMGDADNEF